MGSARRLLGLGHGGLRSGHIPPALPLLSCCPKGAAVPQGDQRTSAQPAGESWWPGGTGQCDRSITRPEHPRADEPRSQQQSATTLGRVTEAVMSVMDRTINTPRSVGERGDGKP